MNLLRAVDAALSAFITELWPVPAPPEGSQLLVDREADEEVAESSFAPVVAHSGEADERPGSDLGVPLATDPGHSHLTPDDIHDAAVFARRYSNCSDRDDSSAAFALSEKLFAAHDAMK